jgi:hypothetical protein
MWQIDRMKQEPVILGEAAAAAMLAVEGMSLSSVDRQRIDSLRREGLSDDAIRAEIIRQFQTPVIG